METRDAIVVGAGITGLAAAFYLKRGGMEPLVLEAADRVGGVIRSHVDDGWCFELGPNTVLEKEPVARLLADSGLADEVAPAAPAGGKRYIWKGTRLVPMPSGPVSFLSTPLFPLSAKLGLVKEPFLGRPPAGTEESIATFVERRLGKPWLDYAVGPFVSGVYAGDPERLSVRWAVPRIQALEDNHGSLIRGALAKRKGPQPGGRMISYQGGLGRLPQRLAERSGEVRTGARVASIERADGGFRVVVGEEQLATKHLILTLPADATATLLEGLTGGSSRILADVPYAPVAVVGLGYPRDAVDHPLDGFGFLAPRIESLRILGGLFTSTLFPGRAPEGQVALTAFLGGRTDPAIVSASDEEILGVVQADFDRAVGLRGEPTHRVVARWPRAIPQYELGHGRYVDWVAATERDIPGLRVAGSFTGGVSVSDSVQRGATAAATILG